MRAVDSTQVKTAVRVLRVHAIVRLIVHVVVEAINIIGGLQLSTRRVTRSQITIGHGPLQSSSRQLMKSLATTESKRSIQSDRDWYLAILLWPGGIHERFSNVKDHIAKGFNPICHLEYLKGRTTALTDGRGVISTQVGAEESSP
ncbi:MAG: hypothetical protein MUC43_17760 [Pirellula sp.]|nr:hypothetical protein [Pirellula sp.]